VAHFVEKVARHAYRVTDDDIAALRVAGHSEEAVYEMTVAASLGAALGRLERALGPAEGARC
jgi:alkylhydroperoxidase family enzyme